MAGWHDTIDVMIRLREWWNSQVGIRYGMGFIESVKRTAASMAPGASTGPGWLAAVARSHIDNAEPFFVSEDVFEMVESASKSFEAEPLLATDLITTNGFALLPRSFITMDRSGKRVNTRAFSWGPCASSDMRIGESAPSTGTYLMLYSDMETEDDFRDEYEQMRPMFGTTGGYSLWHISPWWFGQQVPQIEDFVEDTSGKGYEGNLYLWKWLQTFFRLSMQQMIIAERVIPPRAYARRAKRAGRDPGVLVVKLRRSRPKGFIGNGGEVEWDHRWIVRGHWRNQWYPSLGEHRQIWIVPYVKGPEDKPFKAPDLRVWTFNR